MTDLSVREGNDCSLSRSGLARYHSDPGVQKQDKRYKHAPPSFHNLSRYRGD
jgi:hypothetical protein